MGKKKKKSDSGSKTIALNRKARFNYEILDEWEAGICLEGSEVKSLRVGKSNIADSYAEAKGGEIWLVNAYIPAYKQAGQFNHDTRRPRKLLLHQREINKISGKLRDTGLTLVPLALYFNRKGIAKVQIALAKGKTKYDKRQTEKKREWEREKARLMSKDK